MRREIAAILIFASLTSFAESRHRPRSITEVATLKGEETDEKELARMIQAFRFLLKNEKSPAKRETILMSEASAALALARKYRLMDKPNASTKAMDLQFSKLALTDAEAVLKSSTARVSTRAKAHYYAGLALLNMGTPAEAQQRLLEAIKMDPKADFVPTTSLLIAETSFDQEKYKEAIPQYKMFYSRLNVQQKIIATYKIAWCQLNLQDMELAQKNFLLLAMNPLAGAFQKDAQKDLAFVLVTHRDEPAIIAFANKSIANATVRKDVLTEVYRVYQAQSGTVRHDMLFAELMRIEPDPAKKLSLMISNLRVQQRSYASSEPFNEYMKLRSKMTEWRAAQGSKVFKAIADELEAEVKSLARSYAETFVGQVKTPENIEKKQLGARLVELLTFRIDYYPKAPDLGDSFNQWMDVCTEIKDFKCAYEVSRRVLKDKKLASIRRRAWIQYLNALESLHATDPDLRTKFSEGLIQFTTEMPNDTEFVSFSKRLSALYNEEKRYDLSIPLLKKIHDKENSSESLYRWLWALFQSEQFEKVAAYNQKFTDDKYGKDSRSLVREAHLRLANQKIEKDNFSDYEKHVKHYIESDPDQQKRDLVEKDYLARLLDRKDLAPVQKSLSSMDAKRRLSPVYRPLAMRLFDEQLMRGQFVAAEAMLKGAPANDRELQKEKILETVARTPNLKNDTFADIAQAHPETRMYLLGVLAVTNPEKLVKYADFKKTLTAQELKMLFLAHQVLQGRWDPEFDQKTERTLASVLPTELKASKLTWPEQEASKIQFPTPRTSFQKTTEMIQAVAKRTRSLRNSFVKNVDGKLPRIQTRILTAAVALEEKVASTILQSKNPPGLAAEQIAEYRSGVEALAKEFSDQAGEYKKILNNIDSKVSAEAVEKKPILDFKVEDWEWPDHPAAEPLEKLAQAKNFSGAMIALDRWKRTAQIKDPEYFAFRLKLILLRAENPFIKEYLYNELTSAKQDEVLKNWRKQTS